MKPQSTFRRYEYKYRLSAEQYTKLQQHMESYMKMDEFGSHTINNIYFDTPDYLLIRRSLEKPVYKEKLRVRWYGARGEKTPIFVELKKKYKGVVYKRRFKTNWAETKGYFKRNTPFTEKEGGNQKQILKELDYFMEFYQKLRPALFLGYQREAYFGVENPDLRITFDQNIRCNQGEILHQKNNNGTRIIPRDQVLMEVKTGEGIPQWLLDLFAKEEVFRCSFSKYGTAYQEILLPQQIGGASSIA